MSECHNVYVWTSPKVVWSDEKKFNLDGPDGFSYYWHDLRKEQEIFSTRAQDGGSVMIWASFGWGGKSSICFVDGRMNAMGYREVLRHHLVDIGDSIGGSDSIFQQDNAPIHRATVNATRFKYKKSNVLPWSSLSPDLYPIENLWGILARKVFLKLLDLMERKQNIDCDFCSSFWFSSDMVLYICTIKN